MEDKRLVEYRKAKRAVEKAEEWNNLPSGLRYQGDKFDISIPHCSAPKLTRAGQKYAGGQNYWDTDEELNLALLEYIIDNWDFIYQDVFSRLQDKESAALKKCQTFIDDLQKAINETEVEEED